MQPEDQRPIEIREEQAADHAAVYKLHQAAFGQDDEANLVDALRQGDAFIPALSLVAVIDDVVVGHILFTRIRIRNGSGEEIDSLALAPVAVLPAHQRCGIGGRLIRAGLAMARRLGHASCIVLGHQEYYPRFGFRPASAWAIKAPFDVSDDVFMAMELVPYGLRGVSGVVVYPGAFGS
jgi:predicted N-acetyltransferase YhbS